MKQYRFDVVIIGAGPAGVAAAGALAGTGISVALLEAAVYAGAENWSGCVYFAESLAAKDCFGPEVVEAAPFERRVLRRGTLMHNGLDIVGAELNDPELYRNSYIVLRPIYDPYFAAIARTKGAVHITETTVTSLIRHNGRVIGVQTNRGPLYADVVFLAEGDASHLVRSERLERVKQPHYLQGVKAVLSISPEEIEKRFGLKPGEGAAYEILVRNPSIAGRTARLNIGGFLYTNRDSLSLGYVAPLEHIRDHYRGDHDRLFEWVKGLPYIRELTKDARLSAYGTKIIRSGGWRERPVLVQDGLAVGGASTGLGIDLPFPNYTGPAAASGLYLARAIKELLRQGKPLDARNLTAAYVDPLCESIYYGNAQFLSAWPTYFGKSSVLFGRTVDMVCGTARFLSERSLIETGRFLRSHLLTLRGIRESITDGVRAFGALGLGWPLVKSALNPATIGHWVLNLAKRIPKDPRFRLILHIADRDRDPSSLPAPAGGFLERLSPTLAHVLGTIYANDGKPMRDKFSTAIRIMLRGLRLTDFILLPAFGLLLFFIAIGTALSDAFRFYVLKRPVEEFLRSPVMSYAESQRKIRDLESVQNPAGLDAKLATNTYRVGTIPHIKTLWPESIPAQPEMSQVGLWWVCPARVYLYDAPLAGRGKVLVNFENCIKCESCWRAEPSRVLWGRHTNHKLIYRPESAAITALLDSTRRTTARTTGSSVQPRIIDDTPGPVDAAIADFSKEALNAAVAFRDSVSKLPASADLGRRAWPLVLGLRLSQKLAKLETSIVERQKEGAAKDLESDRKALKLRLDTGTLFHALYISRGIEQRLRSGVSVSPIVRPRPETGEKTELPISYDEISRIFPDRIVKQWEEEPIPPEWAETLRKFIREHRHASRPALRALCAVSPALGLIAAHQVLAANLLAGAGSKPEAGICALNAGDLDIRKGGDAVTIKGTVHLAPVATARSVLLISKGKAYTVSLNDPGIVIKPTPAIGFRASGLADIVLDCRIEKNSSIPAPDCVVPDPYSYLSIALGAGDYLCRRVKEHAAGRVQFPGQMLDTEGRDGIAKLGAVKAMIARTEAWQHLLERLYHRSQRDDQSGDAQNGFSLLCAVIAAMAFGPEHGLMGYDAGQVFGGFAYSEDDLLSRAYRDSALFRFLSPGYGASTKLHAAVAGKDLETSFTDELGSLDSIDGEPLQRLVVRWRELKGRSARLPEKVEPALSGDVQALLLGIRTFLADVEHGLARGKSMEPEAASIEVLLELTEAALLKAEVSAGRGSVSPHAVFPIEPVGKPVALPLDYETFATRLEGKPHRSGTFLETPFDRSPRYVPEMQLFDTRLRTRWEELVAWFKKNCRDKKFDGLDIERYIEKIHFLPEEIIAAVRSSKWLATYIPKSEGGLGWRKAEYYILNSVGGSFGDAAIDLLIMASTSIGTTPILLGLEDELPRVREELLPFAGEPERLGETSRRLKTIIQSFANPNPTWIRKEYEAVLKLVDSRIRRTRVVKYLAANFLRAFYGAGIAGRRGDFGTFVSGLTEAGKLFDQLMPDVRAALEELPRRERCHRLYLQYLGHGGVSAFALTEPTAGSDSGGVKTTARLERADLTPLPDGRYSFQPSGHPEMSIRHMIDADRIAFTERGIFYRTPDGTTAPIMYRKKDPSSEAGSRYYVYAGKECPFQDVGQVRTATGAPIYEYYELTGAKMWITNGSIATQFCLYAQTPEGVTGFMVDRHAEGLKVGADEAKTGQRGSPTNELSLDRVRVPREAVIGYEGHGQVNALETLNVGRCGLAVVSGALMRKLLEEAHQALPASPERDALLGEAAAVLFGSESVAYYLIGLFERPHESVRMESAIAKFSCSEDIHELLSLLEYAFGPKGQTEQYLIEKARRDSRVLTIYEGTNEIQRFLILKDLIAQAANWAELPETGAEGQLVKWKNRLRKYAQEVASLLGETSWSDAMLQPSLFALADMAAEILRIECITYRTEWLREKERLIDQSLPGYVQHMLDAGRRAAERALMKLEALDRTYSFGWERIKSNVNAPEVIAADAALDRAAESTDEVDEEPASINVPVRILSILRPVADLSPVPRLSDGSIAEIVWKPEPLDRAGIAQALALKQASAQQITIDLLFSGPAEQEDVIRCCAGSGVSGLCRINSGDTGLPDVIAEGVRKLETSGKYDLIITGAGCSSGDIGLAPFLAGALGRPYVARAGLKNTQGDKGFSDLSFPCIVGITEPKAAREESLFDLVHAALSPIRLLEPARRREPGIIRYERPAGTGGETKTITNAHDAAEHLKILAARASDGRAEDYTGQLKSARVPEDAAVWALLGPAEQKSNVVVLRASRLAANLIGKHAMAFIAAPKNAWPALVGLAKANGSERAFCVDTGNGALSRQGKRELVRTLIKPAKESVVIAGMDWTEAFALVAGESHGSGSDIRIFSEVVKMTVNGSGPLTLSSPVYDGKLIKTEMIEHGIPLISVAREADFPAAVPSREFEAAVVDVKLKPDWVEPLPPPSEPTLSQADVIIDLGYGIRDRQGMNIALELKKRLEALGLSPMFGATRKVTQDLKLLPLEAQIGQTGVRVNPTLIIALGISGAPQHIDYIGTRAEILCFNKDTEAPLMKLNQTRPAPRVHPIAGDLFVTVRELLNELR